VGRAVTLKLWALAIGMPVTLADVAPPVEAVRPPGVAVTV
jgi:hypothetical protein